MREIDLAPWDCQISVSDFWESFRLHKQEEKALLGAILRDNSLLEYIDGLRPSHFFYDMDCRAFANIRAIVASGRVADAASLKRWADANLSEKYIAELLERAMPGWEQALYYGGLVRDLGIERGRLEAMIASEARRKNLGDGDDYEVPS